MRYNGACLLAETVATRTGKDHQKWSQCWGKFATKWYINFAFRKNQLSGIFERSGEQATFRMGLGT